MLFYSICFKIALMVSAYVYQKPYKNNTIDE